MPVFLLFFIALISIPLTELYLLISIGSEIGAPATIALVILTAVLGAWLLRRQGLSTLARAQAALNAGQLPAGEIVEGLILLVTGVMLLTPGFITDALGFACLVPAVRQRIAAVLAARLVMRVRQPGQTPGASGARTIDGEYRVEDDAAGAQRDKRLP